MAVLGTISGQMLKNNLLRFNTDLIIDGNLMYFDTNNRRVGINTTIPGNALTVNGSVTTSNIYINGNTLTALNGNITFNSLVGNINVSALRITNVATPTSSSDAATKNYVDSALSIYQANSELTVTDSVHTSNIMLNSNSLTITGNSNQITSNLSGNTFTISFVQNPTVYGNITATYFLGNGSQLTGMYGNTQVGSYLNVYTGNISAYNVNANVYTNVINSGGANANIAINPSTSGIVTINSNTGLVVPIGTTSNYPANSTQGMIRWNTNYGWLEAYNGVAWNEVGASSSTIVTSDIFTGDGNTTAFTLSQSNTTQGVLVSINGVIQIPTTSYTVSGTQLTLNEAPLSTDVIEARSYTTTSQVTGIVNGPASVTAYSNGNVYVSGNINVKGNISVNGNLAVNGPVFMVFLQTQQTVSSGLSANVIYNGTTFNIGNFYNTSTGVFQPTTPGYYSFQWTAGCNSYAASTGICTSSLYKNNSEFARAQRTVCNTAGQVVSGSATAYLNGTTDYVTVSFLQGSGSSAILEASPTQSYANWFSGYMARGA